MISAKFEKLIASLLIFALRRVTKTSVRGQSFTLSAARWFMSVKPVASMLLWKRFPTLHKLANFPFRIASDVSWELQEDVARLGNLSRCEYCDWVIYPDHPHEYCDSVLSEGAFVPDDRASSDQDDPNEICPCGHKRNAHFYDEGCCLGDHCECPDFGTPLEEWYQPKQVWFTESPGGHNAWE